MNKPVDPGATGEDDDVAAVAVAGEVERDAWVRIDVSASRRPCQAEHQDRLVAVDSNFDLQHRV